MIRPRKRFGQHWLTSPKILTRIVAAAQLQPNDCVLEIGPGQGILTEQLLGRVESVIAAEIDRDLCRVLQEKFAEQKSFYLIEGDFLALDLPDDMANRLSAGAIALPNKAVANIPYYITGPILAKLLGTISSPPVLSLETIVLLVQKEVADRICAQPGSKTFGAMSVRLQYLADCHYICDVPPGAFYPPPKVTSAVVRLRPRAYPFPATDLTHLDQVVKAGFASRRKMLRNNLQPWVERDRLLALLDALELKPQVRAEDLSVQQWVGLSNKILEDGA
ncbi:MAG: 16S rRNA (adenine(1518)-N(6)/adenine(1519)-N(6))-dimethyltransferase RsmA [Cyanobacteria bacterium P01_H01_bin.119]